MLRCSSSTMQPTSFPPRASPGTRKPHVRGLCYYSDTLLERLEERRHFRKRLQVRLDVRLGVLDRDRPLLVGPGRLRDDSLVQHRQVPGLRSHPVDDVPVAVVRSEEHTSELQSLAYLVCRLLLEKKKLSTI